MVLKLNIQSLFGKNKNVIFSTQEKQKPMYANSLINYIKLRGSHHESIINVSLKTIKNRIEFCPDVEKCLGSAIIQLKGPKLLRAYNQVRGFMSEEQQEKTDRKISGTQSMNIFRHVLDYYGK